MSNDNSIQWLVKTKEGVVEGPFATDEIIYKIRVGFYLGEESIALHPDGEWRPISYEEDFFNILLGALEDELLDKNQAAPEAPLLKKPDSMNPTKEDSKKDKWGKRIVKEQVDPHNTATGLTGSMKPIEGHAIPENIRRKKKKKKKKKKTSSTKPARNIESLPEEYIQQPDGRLLKKKKSQPSRRKNKRASLLGFIGVAFIGVIFLLILENDPETNASQGRFRLLRPQWSKNTQSSTGKKDFEKAQYFFRRDRLADYLRAQELLVALVEKSNSLKPYSYLCMVYKEIWPEVYQDSVDRETLQAVLQKVQKINPQSVEALTCLVVNHFIRGEYDEAFRIMESQLRNDSSVIFFNQMSGDIHAARKEYETAAYYFAKVRQLWSPPPVWAKPILQEARMYRKVSQFNDAMLLYRGLMKAYPRHAVGKIEMGILEFQVFQHIDRASALIASGLREQQTIPRDVESDAYLTLAKVQFEKRNSKRSLNLAQQAFSINSTNTEAREFIIKVGGIKSLSNLQINNVSVIHVAEQFMKMKNYTRAHAQFRAAFEADKENSFAALRAGQALWLLNQGSEAIKWVKKAIDADPKLIQNYLVLSDYLSQRYDYYNAAAALKQARKLKKNNHEIWHGFALVELRRHNPEGAIGFARRALEIYDTDIESLLVMARAYRDTRQMESAIQNIEKARQLDPSHEGVQVTYGEILTLTRGALAGIAYIQKLIDDSPEKVVYRTALAKVYLDEQRYQEAYGVAQEILNINPRHKKTLIMIAKILRLWKGNLGQAEARDYLLEAASLDPSDAEPLYILGQFYLEINQFAKAEKQFRRVLNVNFNYPLAHLKLGAALGELGRLEDAEKMIKKEKSLNPELPESFELHGLLFFKHLIREKDSLLKSHYATSCASEFRKAIGKGLREANTFIWLARCLRLSGALDEAKSMLEEAELIESGNPEIYKEYGALYEIQSEYSQAIFYYSRYLQLSPKAEDFQEIKSIVDGLGRGK